LIHFARGKMAGKWRSDLIRERPVIELLELENKRALVFLVSAHIGDVRTLRLVKRVAILELLGCGKGIKHCGEPVVKRGGLGALQRSRCMTSLVPSARGGMSAGGASAIKTLRKRRNSM
jgi:hypothetical protein